MALVKEDHPPPPVAPMIDVQVGVAALTFVDRQTDCPPAIMVFGSLGSRTKGEMKLDRDGLLASAMPVQMYEDCVAPPLVERWICRRTYSP